MATSIDLHSLSDTSDLPISFGEGLNFLSASESIK